MNHLYAVVRLISIRRLSASLVLMFVVLIASGARGGNAAGDSFETRVEMSDNGTSARNYRLFYDFSTTPSGTRRPSAIMFQQHDLLHHLIFNYEKTQMYYVLSSLNDTLDHERSTCEAYDMNEPRTLFPFFNTSWINNTLLGPANMYRMLAFINTSKQVEITDVRGISCNVYRTPVEDKGTIKYTIVYYITCKRRLKAQRNFVLHLVKR